jgi:DeoR family transcriptional regulator of aga operon
MRGKERRDEILRRVQAAGYVSASALAADFDVDSSTIRRDLDLLARRGAVLRSHGGVRPTMENSDIPYAVKETENVREKRAIAQAAARLVENGQSVVLDSGSTMYELARALRRHRGLTFITNDLRVATEVATHTEIRLMVTGGELLASVYTLVGESAVDFIRDLHVDWTFLGADAIDPTGITNTNSSEVPVKRAMIGCAARTAVLADSTKFSQRALVRVAGLTEVDLIITDARLDDGTAAQYPVEIRRVSTEEHGTEALACSS